MKEQDQNGLWRESRKMLRDQRILRLLTKVRYTFLFFFD